MQTPPTVTFHGFTATAELKEFVDAQIEIVDHRRTHRSCHRDLTRGTRGLGADQKSAWRRVLGHLATADKGGPGMGRQCA